MNKAKKRQYRDLSKLEIPQHLLERRCQQEANNSKDLDFETLKLLGFPNQWPPEKNPRYTTVTGCDRNHTNELKGLIKNGYASASFLVFT